MKRFIQITTLVLILAAAIPAAGATEKKFTGDAARVKPPVPNYPSHIRNVIWRTISRHSAKPKFLLLAPVR